MKSYLDNHLRVVHAVLIVSEDVYFLGPFFLNFRSFYGHFRLAPNEGKEEDVKLSAYKYKIIFSTHLGDASGFARARNVEAFFGPFRSYSYHFRVYYVNPK
jgi:hypothetical protein